jgi:hypothetical protein
VVEQATDPGADLNDLFGRVDGAIIHILCPTALCGRGPPNRRNARVTHYSVGT